MKNASGGRPATTGGGSSCPHGRGTPSVRNRPRQPSSACTRSITNLLTNARKYTPTGAPSPSTVRADGFDVARRRAGVSRRPGAAYRSPSSGSPAVDKGRDRSADQRGRGRARPRARRGDRAPPTAATSTLTSAPAAPPSRSGYADVVPRLSDNLTTTSGTL